MTGPSVVADYITALEKARVELQRAGVIEADMEPAVRGVMQLAARGQIAVDKATEIASIAVDKFNLTGNDITGLAALLAHP